MALTDTLPEELPPAEVVRLFDAQVKKAVSEAGRLKALADSYGHALSLLDMVAMEEALAEVDGEVGSAKRSLKAAIHAWIVANGVEMRQTQAAVEAGDEPRSKWVDPRSGIVYKQVWNGNDDELAGEAEAEFTNAAFRVIADQLAKIEDGLAEADDVWLLRTSNVQALVQDLWRLEPRRGVARRYEGQGGVKGHGFKWADALRIVRQRAWRARHPDKPEKEVPAFLDPTAGYWKAGDKTATPSYRREGVGQRPEVRALVQAETDNGEAGPE